jgi:HTH-type transcriptional regulator, sugar sensing transcriptional regulator
MNFLDIFQLDRSGIDEEIEAIATVLREVGLSDYEARSYIALVAMDHGTAEGVGETAGIPRTSAYKVLRSLEIKGFINSMEGRPILYHPVAPEEIRGEIIERISQAFGKLSQVKGLLSERGVPQLVFTIAGKEKVIEKIGEMLDRSKRSFIISTPMIKELRQEHEARFREAVRRKVEVLLLTEPSMKVPSATKVYRKSGLLATDVISDGEMALIAAPDLSLCGYTDNPFLAKHIESFLKGAIDRLE